MMIFLIAIFPAKINLVKIEKNHNIKNIIKIIIFNDLG